MLTISYLSRSKTILIIVSLERFLFSSVFHHVRSICQLLAWRVLERLIHYVTLSNGSFATRSARPATAVVFVFWFPRVLLAGNKTPLGVLK